LKQQLRRSGSTAAVFFALSIAVSEIPTKPEHFLETSPQPAGQLLWDA
jgi:hypothetical protein